jgi:FkbM family methyltransferase
MSKERLLKDFLKHSRINCVLDVGAFIGNYVLELRKLGYQGRVISFEPVPDSFAQMIMKLKSDTSWSGQPYGLSDVNRDAIINTYASGDFNSLLTLKLDAESAYGLDHAMRGKIQIKLRRLDEILPALLQGIESPRIFLKMDTQGHDVNVLRGALGIQKWIVGLQSEMPAVHLYEDMPSMPQMLDYYRSWGFVPAGLYPVNSLRSKQITPEFDVIFNSFEGHLTGTA